MALHSNENMLVCAPTGAGKTNVAMLSIMQQVGMCIEGGVLNRESLKVVYIAPMKALAQEIVGKFAKALAPLGLQVREYTGDMQLTKREITETQIIVTTPEKWDVVTRKGSDALVSAVGLLIIDEVLPCTCQAHARARIMHMHRGPCAPPHPRRPPGRILPFLTQQRPSDEPSAPPSPP